MAVLPPDMDAATFARVLEEFRGAIGADWVWSSEDDLGPYRDSFSPVWDTAEERRASEAAERPFRIESPRGPPTFRHRVEYEVTAQGFRTARRTVYLEPGKLTLVEGTLERS